ncbi:ATP synthase F1 subunit epsilon [Marinitoga sp. 1135]|uniref:ATP synthase epsilon chain n=1 Tax=Marinitoga piezophila (strain DSM 14283 / JCM 11233 / KA3) TaxID=443254 RepID=H2J4P4_MARPK|nr:MULTISPECIES: ATP synthase F1 subunit epsilon [Marinitoga]AEX85986.1 ATP synthase, F1 epsilon subunit [Marinitoga piezophila KA3]APT76409.1 ATP synthase F1 subunit epsilon [Marinitoga sp. 1137]NUU96179.1 ATP synthase F1 subunit epsilon [Marinitoga sp. 1135]NUU98087.1 ATP synthase F1 subunit epsilon [Marinitoga sp. 1138]
MFDLKIVTPKGVKTTIEAEYAEFTTIEGGMGVLTNRLPIVAKLKVAPLKVRHKDGKEEVFAVHGGILEMDGKEMIVLTTAAERPDEIDVETAMKAIEAAKEKLNHAESSVEKAKVQAEIEKNMVRISIAKK